MCCEVYCDHVTWILASHWLRPGPGVITLSRVYTNKYFPQINNPTTQNTDKTSPAVGVSSPTRSFLVLSERPWARVAVFSHYFIISINVIENWIVCLSRGQTINPPSHYLSDSNQSLIPDSQFSRIYRPGRSSQFLLRARVTASRCEQWRACAIFRGDMQLMINSKTSPHPRVGAVYRCTEPVCTAVHRATVHRCTARTHGPGVSVRWVAAATTRPVISEHERKVK